MNEVEKAHLKQALDYLVSLDNLLKELYDYMNQNPRQISERNAPKFTDLKRNIEDTRKKLNEWLATSSPEHHKQLLETVERNSKKEWEKTLRERKY